jgi:hypothetical protein
MLAKEILCCAERELCCTRKNKQSAVHESRRRHACNVQLAAWSLVVLEQARSRCRSRRGGGLGRSFISHLCAIVLWPLDAGAGMAATHARGRLNSSAPSPWPRDATVYQRAHCCALALTSLTVLVSLTAFLTNDLSISSLSVCGFAQTSVPRLGSARRRESGTQWRIHKVLASARYCHVSLTPFCLRDTARVVSKHSLSRLTRLLGRRRLRTVCTSTMSTAA